MASEESKKIKVSTVFRPDEVIEVELAEAEFLQVAGLLADDKSKPTTDSAPATKEGK